MLLTDVPQQGERGHLHQTPRRDHAPGRVRCCPGADGSWTLPGWSAAKAVHPALMSAYQEL